MIQFHETSFGCIPEVKNRLLASKLNPVREAEAWVKRQALASESLIVMGYGAGFHIAALKEAYPKTKVYCFDIHQEIREKYSDQIHIFSEAEEEILAVLEETKFRHQVLIHKPSYLLDPSAYDSILDILNARSAITLDACLASRAYKLNQQGSQLVYAEIHDRILCHQLKTQNLRAHKVLKCMKELLR